MLGFGARSSFAALLLVATVACTASPARETARPGQSGAARVTVVDGFSGPESVRYDPEADVYFVSNFNGNPNQAKNDGFISRMRPDGTIEQLRFIAGGANGVTLHAPRGMTIVGDTLWAADHQAVRGFHRRTGAPVATIDFSSFDTGFLNDVTPGPDGALYVTDTGRSRVYRIMGRTPTLALDDTTLNRPNGITWDRFGNRAIVLPFGGKQQLLAWRPGQAGLETIASGLPGGRYDGVEVLAAERLLVSSQADSSLHVVVNGRVRSSVRTLGAPADIGVDTRRNRVAVPFVALNQVEILEVPR